MVVFGGANCEGPMGRALLANFAVVDVVVSGEGEIPFVEIVDRVDRGVTLDGCPGAITRRDLAPLSVRGDDHPHPIAMDELPIPDFADFFEQWSALNALSDRAPRLLFESARGCWWGEIRHCTFCGLNGETMSFRSKSADRAVAELCELASRHPGLAIYAVDNIIDRGYFDTFLPRLAASPVTPASSTRSRPTSRRTSSSSFTRPGFATSNRASRACTTLCCGSCARE